MLYLNLEFESLDCVDTFILLIFYWRTHNVIPTKAIAIKQEARQSISIQAGALVAEAGAHLQETSQRTKPKLLHCEEVESVRAITP